MAEQLMDTRAPRPAEADLTPAKDESLVTDNRAGLTPAQMVERKLLALLKASPLPMSHVHRLGGFRQGRS
jgi:hypothetical protein